MPKQAGSQQKPDADEKPDFKATLTIAAYDMDTLMGAINALQEQLIGEGAEVEGRIKYDVPLTYRMEARPATKIVSGTPMDKMWNGVELAENVA
jgi:hypothetical protein